MKIRFSVGRERDFRSAPVQFEVNVYYIDGYQHMELAWLHGIPRAQVASAVIRSLPQNLIFGFEETLLEVDMPETALTLLKALAELPEPTEQEVESIMDNPTLQNLENLLSIKKLLTKPKGENM